MTPSHLHAAAELFAKTGNASLLANVTPWALQDEMIRYATAHASGGEAPAAALVRLSQYDDTLKALAKAAYHAEQAMQRRPAKEQLAALRKHLGADVAKSAPAHGSREQIADLMDAIAKREQREGETFYDAYARLAEEDAEFKKAYAVYNAS
jgi:hypothetical protein